MRLYMYIIPIFTPFIAYIFFQPLCQTLFVLNREKRDREGDKEIKREMNRGREKKRMNERERERERERKREKIRA